MSHNEKSKNTKEKAGSAVQAVQATLGWGQNLPKSLKIHNKPVIRVKYAEQQNNMQEITWSTQWRDQKCILYILGQGQNLPKSYKICIEPVIKDKYVEELTKTQEITWRTC